MEKKMETAMYSGGLGSRSWRPRKSVKITWISIWARGIMNLLPKSP